MQESLSIETNRNLINWPLNTDIDQNQLKDQLDIRVRNEKGKLVDADIFIMTKAVDTTKQGQYYATIVVEDTAGNSGRKRIEIDVVKMRNDAKTPEKFTGNKKNKLKLIIIAILVIICIVIGIRSCHNSQEQAANNASQSSQISDNSSSIKDLEGKNQDLTNQLAALKAAVKQYQKDKDQQELQNTLNSLVDQNNQLKVSLSQSDQNRLNQLNSAAQNIANNPSNATSELNKLNSNNGFSSMWNNITNQVQQWINQNI